MEEIRSRVFGFVGLGRQQVKSRKICMLTTFFPPYNFGGDGIFVYRLTNALARQGNEVHVIHDVDAFKLLNGKPAQADYPLHPNVTVHPLSLSQFASLDLILQHQLGRPVMKQPAIARILKEHDFDVMHFHNISLLGGPQLLSYPSRAVKLCTTHDHWFVCATHTLWRYEREACTQRTCLSCTLHSRKPPQIWRYNGRLPRITQEVDAFIAPSHFARESHLRNGFPGHMVVLPNFMPDEDVKRLQAVKGDYQHPRPFFLFVGRLEKLKGLQVVLEVFRHYDKADLLVIGTGTYEAELRAMAVDLPHVHFMGFMGHEQISLLYQQSIAVIVPSICFETFGWVSLEAFIVQTPVIANRLGALTEVVEGAGFLYETPQQMIDSMEQLRNNPDLRVKLGAQGYARYLENYTEAHHLTAYDQLITQIEAKHIPAR
jgi:glycosyltransferase involved in cell wall biosynthesis